MKPRFYLLITAILIGCLFHLYNLNWGSPFYFHPDERQNIAYPILESKSSLLHDQKNFDIGTLPLIVIKNIHPMVGYLAQISDPLAQVIVTARLVSALLSLATAYLVYKVAKKNFGDLAAYISLFLILFFVGSIQYSHFGTVEIWEAFFIMLIFSLTLKLFSKPTLAQCVLVGIVTGLAVATKLLTLVAVPAVIVTILIAFYKISNKKSAMHVRIFKTGLPLILYFLTTGITILVIMPNIIMDFNSAYSSMQFESKVAIGTLPVFYTQGFYGTIPYLFQFTHVYPFLIGPINTILLIFAIFYTVKIGFRKKSYIHFLVVLFFLVILILQGHFLAKWARYYIPSLPFAAMLLGVFIAYIYTSILKGKLYAKLFLVSILGITFGYAVVFFISIYLQPHTTITANKWATKNIPTNSLLLAEPYDLGIQPFYALTPHITFFNFYELDSDPLLQEELPIHLDNNNYVILTSQRVIRSRFKNPQLFPKSFQFYTDLMDEKLYTKIYQTPCDAFCKLLYMGNPIFNVEETVNVFDRPIVTIFQKNNP